MKRPSFQFYPGDWRSNAKLRRCSFAERGVWLEVLALMHDSEQYGVLTWPLQDIALAVGCRVEQAGPLWYSSRMVRDEYVRTKRGIGTSIGVQPNSAPMTAPKPPIGDGASSSSSSSSSKEAEAGGNDALPDCPHERIIALYHELLPTCRRVMKWTTRRQTYLQQRWRENSKANGTGAGYASVDAGIAWWREFFTWVASSKFLTGRAEGGNGRRPFTADLEWLLKPDNFTKVFEGKYHDNRAAT